MKCQVFLRKYFNYLFNIFCRLLLKKYTQLLPAYLQVRQPAQTVLPHCFQKAAEDLRECTELLCKACRLFFFSRKERSDPSTAKQEETLVFGNYSVIFILRVICYIRQFGKKSFTCGHNNTQFLFNILSNAYSQHCTTSWLNEISFLSASVCSFSISSSGIRIVLFDFCWFLISNILITSALIILVQKSLEIYK